MRDPKPYEALFTERGVKIPNAGLTFNMSLSHEAHTHDYKPLAYRESNKNTSHNEFCGIIAAEFLNKFFGESLSAAQWDKRGKIRLQWNVGATTHRRVVTLREMRKALREHRSWKGTEVPYPDTWLDHAQAISIDSQATVNELGDAALIFSAPLPGIPLKASLDREGALFSSMLPNLEQITIAARHQAVAESHQLYAHGNRNPTAPNYVRGKSLRSDWFDAVVRSINTSIAMVECTLTLLYYRAKYEHAKFGWTFDEKALGSPHERRLMDKISWVGAITGATMADLGTEIRELRRLKTVRNHLNHFDPPVFAFSIEDLAGWLNNIRTVGILLWKLRRKLGLPLSLGLIEIVLAPHVDPVPRDPNKRRPAQADDCGYGSCRWQDDASVRTSTPLLYFLIRFKDRRGEARLDVAPPGWHDHIRYYHTLSARGYSVLEARYRGDPRDSFVVIACSSREHLDQLLAEDPAIKLGSLDAEVEELTVGARSLG